MARTFVSMFQSIIDAFKCKYFEPKNSQDLTYSFYFVRTANRYDLKITYMCRDVLTLEENTIALS